MNDQYLQDYRFQLFVVIDDAKHLRELYCTRDEILNFASSLIESQIASEVTVFQDSVSIAEFSNTTDPVIATEIIE